MFAGKIVVRRDAQKTNAYQSNNNLLLSPDAEIDTKPELEIFADDVKCSHGATAGELDERELFYLRSRGLDVATARSVLTFAFAGEVLERFGNPAIARQARAGLLAACRAAPLWVSWHDRGGGARGPRRPVRSGAGAARLPLPASDACTAGRWSTSIRRRAPRSRRW